MTTNAENLSALAQHAAEALPLPDSRPTSPVSQIDSRPPDASSPDLEQACNEVEHAENVSIDVASETTDDASDIASIKFISDKSVCAKIGHDITAAGDPNSAPMDEETQQTTDDRSDTESTSIKSTDCQDDIAKIVTEPTAISTERQLSDISTKAGPSSSQAESSGEFVKSVNSGDVQYVDQFDTENQGDVVGNYFTTRTRGRALSPVHEDRCVNLQVAANSDLYLKIKGDDDRVYIFEVDSTALASHSPVFYNMAYETHTRGNQESWIWELKGDSVLGLTVMLSLLHLELTGTMFNQEPKPEDVYHVLCVFNKYQIPQVAYHPWVKSWTAGFRQGLETTKLSMVECLYVAHQLGDFKSLKACIRHVAHEVEIDVDGSARLASGHLIREVAAITNDLVAAVLDIRTADLHSLLDPFMEAHEILMGGTRTEDPKFCKSVDHHVECNQAMLGSLIGSLVQQKLYPVPTVGSYNGQVGSLANKISVMEIRGLFLPGLEPHKQRHSLCRLGQDYLARKLLNNEMYLPLPEQLVEHFFGVAKRLGVYECEKSEFRAYEDHVKKLKDDDDSRLSDKDSGVFDDGGAAGVSPRCSL